MACPTSSVVTSGTCTGGGPVETNSVTVVPTGALRAGGRADVDDPAGGERGARLLDVLARLQAGDLDRDLAWPTVSPTTVGTARVARARGDRERTVEPCLTLVPACGSWRDHGARRLRAGHLDRRATVKPSFWSWVGAVLSSSPTTPGTTVLTGREDQVGGHPAAGQQQHEQRADPRPQPAAVGRLLLGRRSSPPSITSNGPVPRGGGAAAAAELRRRPRWRRTGRPPPRPAPPCSRCAARARPTGSRSAPARAR